MAKLTDEQKAANKADRKVRDAAFSARYKAYRVACEEADRDWKSSSEHAAYEKVDADREAIFAERDAGVLAIEQQIEALQAKLEAFKKECETRLEPLRDVRNQAYKERERAKRERMGKVNLRFPDMVGVYSASAWNPDLVPKA